MEAIRTEFPIFQALSTPSSPQFQLLDNESSRDDLHVNQVDMLDEIVSPTKATTNSTAYSDERRTEGEKSAVEEEKYLERGEFVIINYSNNY